MKFTDLVFQTLLEEVKNKKLFSLLMDNWRKERPNITDEEGEKLFYDFERIKGGLRPDLAQVYTFLSRYDGEHGYSKFDPNNLRQIDKYSYSQLKFLLDEYFGDDEIKTDVFAGKDTNATPERIDASKNMWFGNDNLIFERDGLRVYDIKDQQMSIRYGYFYHTVYKNALGKNQASDREISPWCVTWRPDMGKSNMWGSYRNERSFYFIIDESKSPNDRYYMGALQVVPSASSGFILTSLLNDGDNRKSWDEIEDIYPQLKGEKSIFKVKPFSADELTLKDVVGQINERTGHQFEFKRIEKQFKKAYIQNGGSLQKPESWRSMDDELRNLYIVYPQINQYNVKERYNNFDFLSEIKKVGNQFNLLDRTLKEKGIGDGVGTIIDHLMRNEFKIARVSADNSKIRMYESKINGKSGLFNVSTNSWIQKDGKIYEPKFDHIDTDVYVDSEGNTYIVDTYSTTTQPNEDSFYSVYNVDDPDVNAHFMSSKQFKILMNELSPEDGNEPETDKPSEYSDIKEKRGY